MAEALRFPRIQREDKKSLLEPVLNQEGLDSDVVDDSLRAVPSINSPRNLL